MKNKSTLTQLLAVVVFFIPLCGMFAQQNVWIPKSNFPTTRAYGVGFSIGAKGYIGTGFGQGIGYPKDFWEWDQATDVWTQKANFGGGGRTGAVGFSIGTKGYIGTGNDGTTSAKLRDFWEWDQAANTWVQKANFGGTARDAAVGFSIGTKGYIGTGVDVNYTKDFWEYDQATDTWTQKANFAGAARDGAVAFSIGAKGYIGTGRPYKNDFWEWDQATNAWTQKANFGGLARCYAVGFSIPGKGKGYIGTGGTTAAAQSSDFWEWDQATNTWTQKADVGGPPKTNAMGFSIGDKGYICGGWQHLGISKPVADDFWEYTPDTSCIASAVISSDPGTTVCVGATVYISASGATTYLWNTGATTANIAVNPTVTTTYSVTVTDASGCTGISAFTVPVDPGCTATGISYLNDEFRADIWPNPSAGTFHLSMPLSFKEGTVEVYSVMGEKVFSSPIEGVQDRIIDLSILPGGIYYLRVSGSNATGFSKQDKTGSEILYEKIIIQK